MIDYELLLLESPTLPLYEFLILSDVPLSHYYLPVNNSRLNITSACN